MRRIRQDANRKEGKEVGYLEYGAQAGNRSDFHYKNYFEEIMNLITMHIGEPWSCLKGDVFPHKELIDRCFYPSTVQEIMENLRKESHPFA